MSSQSHQRTAQSLWLMVAHNRSASEGVKVADSEANKERKKARRGSEIYRPCVYACVGRCRNSSRATINPDTKETQQRGKHTELGFMHWHNFTRGFFSSACALLQNIGHWQEGIWDSIISTQSNTSSSTCCQRSAYQTGARRHSSFSAGHIFILEMMGKIHFHPIKSHFQDKNKQVC